MNKGTIETTYYLLSNLEKKLSERKYAFYNTNYCMMLLSSDKYGYNEDSIAIAKKYYDRKGIKLTLPKFTTKLSSNNKEWNYFGFKMEKKVK